jgi:hypothetical protein
MRGHIRWWLLLVMACTGQEGEEYRSDAVNDTGDTTTETGTEDTGS